MKSVLAAAVALLTVLPAMQAKADGPNLQFGSDTRQMSNTECLNRAKFAMGEQALGVCATDGSDVAGCGGNVTVLVTCFPVGNRTFISVVGASPDPDTAGRFRNAVRSLVMGPAN
jgi:hypothetical protein